MWTHLILYWQLHNQSFDVDTFNTVLATSQSLDTFNTDVDTFNTILATSQSIRTVIHKLASDNIEKAQKKQTTYYDQRFC